MGALTVKYLLKKSGMLLTPAPGLVALPDISAPLEKNSIWDSNLLVALTATSREGINLLKSLYSKVIFSVAGISFYRPSFITTNIECEK